MTRKGWKKRGRKETYAFGFNFLHGIDYLEGDPFLLNRAQERSCTRFKGKTIERKGMEWSSSNGIANLIRS